MTISPEATFIPVRHPHEIVSKVEGEKLLRKIDKLLARVMKYGLILRAKLDPHHHCYFPEETYCVEVVPFMHLESYWFDGSDWTTLKKGLDILFDGMAALGLRPIVTTRRNGVEKDWPGGGCHLHCGMGFVYSGPAWYSKMEQFHKDLVVDYANRPYIRWLFKQWFADTGGAVITTKTPMESRNAAEVFPRSFGHGEIEARFMATTKNTYPTFELRMFSMVANPDELRAIVRFAEAWIDSNKGLAKPREVNISNHYLRKMSDLREARKICANFIDELGLNWDDYVSFFNRNYVKRVRYGKMI